MQYFLRKLNMDWADEFSTFGMKIYTELEHGRLVDALESVKGVEVEWGFGTNEYHCTKISDFVRNTEVHLIDGDTADALETLFPHISTYGIGLCADIEQVLEGGYTNEHELNTAAVNEYWRYKNEQYELNRTES